MASLLQPGSPNVSLDAILDDVTATFDQLLLLWYAIVFYLGVVDPVWWGSLMIAICNISFVNMEVGL